jgi:ribosomal protein L21E
MEKNRIKQLIKEVLQNYKPKESCSCGCNTCGDELILAPILNESKGSYEILSEGLKYHITHKKPLIEQTYRAGSREYFKLWNEARELHSKGIIEITHPEDLELIKETDLGKFGIIYEIEIGDKVKASKEYGGMSGTVVDIKGSFIIVKTKEGNKSYHESDLKVLNKEGKKVPLDFPMIRENLNEAEYQGKKVQLGKPKRGGASGKKYYVYVKDGDKVKKVSFGDAGGLKAKINDPKARRAFAKRHKCGTGEPRTSARFWSCRLPRFSKLLGLKSNFTGFW